MPLLTSSSNIRAILALTSPLRLQGLNGLAGASGTPVGNPSVIFASCNVGSGTNPNEVASGGITFTQATNIVTASGGFFTAAMVGWIFKYGTGTGGAEYYITGYTSSTVVTVDTSTTVSTPTVATVWNVTQTALQSGLYVNDSYQTAAGNCGTTISGGQATHQRYFKFNQKGTTYTVNEIGYGNGILTPTGLIAGRFVLGASDSISPSQFYVVIMQFIIVYGPVTPTAVSNVGTAINTAGTIMLEAINNVNAFAQVLSTGASSGVSALEENENVGLLFSTAAYAQNGSPNSTGINWLSSYISPGTTNWAYAGSRGQMEATFTSSMATSGQTLYGIGISLYAGNIWLDVLFTTPQTAPVGTFQPNTVWKAVYNRVLSN